ncbi:MAG: alkaline phosphatase family protein [Anaerolineales bacterium]|nr:alkaline phosphatase family protein [Anaerolineales bacterium]
MKTLILGFDSFNPATFEDMLGKGQMPNFEKFNQWNGYSRLDVCSPPQTEVSWTSIATGTDPGGHGIFDFVHRDPGTYMPYVSILPTRKSALGEQFVPPYTAKTFFEEASELGYPATALWWPAMFPARPELPVMTIPGLGTPDIRGQLGVGTFFTTETEEKKKVRVVKLESTGKNRYQAELPGPQVPSKTGPKFITLPLTLDIIDNNLAELSIDGKKIQLRLGKWSEIIELKFKAGLLVNVHAITQVILTNTNGVVRFYVQPLQIHPLHSTFNYTASKSFVKKLWTEVGPFLTLGWPQDTTGLEDGCINDEQFLDLCQLIFDQRIRILYHLMGDFREGVLAAIFDDLDRVQHMFFHNRQDIVRDWYQRLDRFVGDVQQKISGWDSKHRFIVMSDHGFSNFQHKVHLNRWLLNEGYLAFKNGNTSGDLTHVDWAKTRAYSVGLNSIYLNIQGREGQGIVQPDAIESTLAEIKDKLVNWKNSNGDSVVEKARLKHEVYSGPYTRLGPDLIVGYAAGYRSSAETGVGKIPEAVMEPNTDHWGADHCMDADIVPGVLFANRDLRDFGAISFRDIPFLAIGKHLDQSHVKPPSHSAGGQGQKDIEERLKGLGYL